MSALVERVRQQLSELQRSTANYAYTTAGLQPKKKIVAHVTRALKQRRAESVDDAQYLDLIRQGEGRSTAARRLGIDPVSLHRRLKHDAVFLEAVLVAEAESLEPIVKMLRERAADGDTKTAFKLLEAKSHEEFGERDRSITVDINHTFDADDPIVARIKALEAGVIARRQAKQLGPSVIDAEVVDDD